MKARPLFSIVVPIYQNAENIPDTVPELLKVQGDFDLELVFVDDGSTDSSLDQLKDFQKKFSNILILKLSKNFGQISATRAGLAAAHGDCVGIISADLQDPPELFLKMHEHWQLGSKLVIAERTSRQEFGIGTLFSLLYWRLVRALALPGYPIGGFDFCLLDRQLVDQINGIHEKNTQIFPLIYSLGYRPAVLKYERRQRLKGKSQWTFWKKMKVFIDTFVSFSYTPIRMVSFIGILASLLSFVFGGYVVFSYFRLEQKVSGWTSVVTLTTFFGGLILVSLGVIGEYLWRILDQVRKRPLYVIDEIFKK